MISGTKPETALMPYIDYICPFIKDCEKTGVKDDGLRCVCIKKIDFYKERDGG